MMLSLVFAQEPFSSWDSFLHNKYCHTLDLGAVVSGVETLFRCRFDNWDQALCTRCACVSVLVSVSVQFPVSISGRICRISPIIRERGVYSGMAPSGKYIAVLGST
jgi:hypothetical protein